MFNKRKDDQELSVFDGIMNAMDNGVIVASKECGILLVNDAAKSLLPEEAPVVSCKESFSRLFTNFCNNCPNCMTERQEKSTDYVIKNNADSYYSVRYNNVEWKDGKQAVAIFLRNIDEERNSREKLYSLAYIDQLTGIANRSQLKEDFDAIEKQIASTQTVGALAIFDLDNFKTINDSYGHSIGDIMLKRLTSHLESVERIRGHLYRLGGDEFVLVYTDPANRFSSLDECQAYYVDMLKDTLRSYSLPNIDIGCTLSIGVSFFPWHGEDFTNLFRRADIALYKAKERGRNQICLFEEAFDSVQKLNDIYINIRPVLTQDGGTYGYELLEQNANTEDKGNSLKLNDFDRTLEVLGLEDLDSGVPYFIAYTNQLHNHTIAKQLPENKLIVDIRITGANSSGDLKNYENLSALGYPLRFSGIDSKNASPEIMRLASYCSFDSAEKDENFKSKTIIGNPAIKFIATDVDTLAQFENAKSRGYSLFQGFFFKHMTVVKKIKEIDQLKISYLRLLKFTSMDETVNFREISEIISSDVALTYKLLRLLNSAAVGLRSPISSIPLAVTYLGEVNLKKWIAMLALRGVAEGKPMELVRLSQVRARFGENLCEFMKPSRDSKMVFLLGMLSLLDVALEKSKEEVFKEIPVADEIKDSLLTNNGPYSDLVAFFSDYEHARWEGVTEFTNKNQMTDTQVNNAYLAAVKWYNDMLDEG